MTLDEALEAAILGEKVRAVDMQAGSFIDYNFSGWRINTANGSSSFYTIKEHDKTVDWEIYIPPVVDVGWGDFKAPNPKPFAIEPGQGRRGRKPKAKPTYEFTGEAVPLLNQKKNNPWAEAGLTDDKPADTGWAVFNKD